MNPPPPRKARIVLVTPDGRLLGALPAVPVATPWWQDIEPVVRAVRQTYGVEVTVLRLLEVGEPVEFGIEITYLAETPTAVAAGPWAGVLDEQPLRLPYARPGGPAADLAWAQDVLSDRGHVRTGPPTQVRTWNLSSLWSIPVQGQTLWLKVVPPFFAHEGALLQALAGGRTPELLGHEGGRMLMTQIPGEDLYGAPLPDLLRMVELLVDLQRAWRGRTDDLLRLGLPDWRAAPLSRAIDAVIARNAAQLGPKDRAALDGFAAGLAARFAEIAACGLPDTLVHGDFHPGNLRGNADVLILLDWGDSGVGHPLLDQSAFLDRIPSEAVEPVREHWHAAWRAAAPGSDPARASALLAPVAAARQAVIYQGFLDRIEPSEQPYHRSDPLDWLQRTAALVRTESR
jgi:Ser/Thr protein kinase RdoA (MazF antagonist)